MCDCPTAGVFTTHETHRSWIIFQECKTEHGSTNTVQAGSQSSTTTVPDSSGNRESDLDSMYLLLDPHLRPATPDFSDRQSVALFEEHKQLAQDYLKVQTELALLSQKKDKLQAAQMLEEQNVRERIKKLQSEKNELVLLREFLKNQVEPENSSSRQDTDGWEIVNRHDSSC